MTRGGRAISCLGGGGRESGVPSRVCHPLTSAPRQALLQARRVRDASPHGRNPHALAAPRGQGPAAPRPQLARAEEHGQGSAGQALRCRRPDVGRPLPRQRLLPRHRRALCLRAGACACRQGEPPVTFLCASLTLPPLQTDPLTITDGLHRTEPSLTPACLHRLRAQRPDGPIAVGAVWAVERYTIRYTSYGPPRSKLRIIMDAVDCVDVRPSKLPPSAEALNRSSEIASALQLLHSARVQDDDRCLRSQPKEQDASDDGYTMAGADEPLDEGASTTTQMPFGTQLQHPIRARHSEDDISIVGVKPLEPVMAGNTQRAELKPRPGSSAMDRQKQAQLLSLLGKGRAQQAAAPQSPARPHARSMPEPSRSGESVPTASSQRRETPGKRANRERLDELVARASQIPQDKGKKRMREAETESPPHNSAKKTSFSENQLSITEDQPVAECPWMKGLTFNRATATVPKDQSYLLDKPESWVKQSKFPPANIPTSLFVVFSRMTDEKAALEGTTSSGSFHETPSSASYPSNSNPQPTDEQDSDSESDSEDEVPTSPVSWHTSPSPEPPQRPTPPPQELPPEPPRQPTPPRLGLPPDSSLEMPKDATEPQKSAVKYGQPPMSTLPNSSREHEDEAPPSSPPAQLIALDSDDDMELETSVPQALGEDLAQSTSVPAQVHVTRPETNTKSVVQVKETPYLKGKNGQQPVVTVCPPTQESASHSSSASIVRGTYQELSSSLVEETRLDGLRRDYDDHPHHASAQFQDETQNAHTLPGDDAQDTDMLDFFAQGEPLVEVAARDDSERQAHNLQPEVTATIQVQPEPTPMSAQLPPKDSSSGEQPTAALIKAAIQVPAPSERRPSRQPSDTPSLVKRRLEASPAQERRRGSKVKRPKYAFGGLNPEIMIRERREAERIQRQNSTTSAESRQGSVSNASVQLHPDTSMEDLDAKKVTKAPIEVANATAAGSMSPRHQSLYATPSPVLRPAATPLAAAAVVEDINLEQQRRDALEDQAVSHVASKEHADVPQEATPSRVRSLSESRPEPVPEPEPALVPKSPPASAPVPKSLPEPSPRIEQVPVNKETVPATAPDADPSSVTVFEKFKAAYPEYKASSKHFANQCKLIEELDREDRMVPKWMWDDFIVRNRTDYAQYAAECIESGEEPIKYIRFYKDTIRDAIFKKGVVETRVVLEKALKELGVRDSATTAPAPQPRVQQAAQKPLERPSQPTAHRISDVRRPRRESAQESPREFVQPSPRQPALRQTYSPLSPAPQPALTSPKRASRKSLPFPVPSSAVSSRVNGTADPRHSLPAGSSRTAPTSTAAQTASARPAAGTQRKSRSTLGNSLRWYKADPSASPLETGTGNEYRDFIKAQEALSATTGSKRVSSAPVPRNPGGTGGDNHNN